MKDKWIVIVQRLGMMVSLRVLRMLSDDSLWCGAKTEISRKMSTRIRTIFRVVTQFVLTRNNATKWFMNSVMTESSQKQFKTKSKCILTNGMMIFHSPSSALFWSTAHAHAWHCQLGCFVWLQFALNPQRLNILIVSSRSIAGCRRNIETSTKC